MGFHRWRTGVRTWKVTKEFARAVRRNPTKAKALLWKRLRNRQVTGAKFRRQHEIGPFLADLCCPEAMLVIEVDGPIHDQPEAMEDDAERNEYLEAGGFRILHFRNEAVLGNVEAVIAEIASALAAAKTR